MNDGSYIELIHQFLADANAASVRGDRDITHYNLAQAAAAANAINDDHKRRHALSHIAKNAVNVQYPELSQQLAQQLIRLDRKLGNIPWLITDLLTYGSSYHHSEQFLEAEEVYQQAYELAVEIKSWQRAAAASSNYAMALAARGALEDAKGCLERSLKYLQSEPDLDTEIRTRAALFSVAHALGEKPSSCIKMVRQILDDHAAELTESHRIILRNQLDPILRSFFGDNPNIDPPEWVEEHLPELMEESHDQALL